MSVTVSFSREMCADHATLPASKTFENHNHLRDTLRMYVFAPVYRIRTHLNEFGLVTSKLLLAVMDDGREHYIGEIQ